jgi:hypothetical protein
MRRAADGVATGSDTDPPGRALPLTPIVPEGGEWMMSAPTVKPGDTEQERFRGTVPALWRQIEQLPPVPRAWSGALAAASGFSPGFPWLSPDAG